MNDETYDPPMRYTEPETRGSLGGVPFADMSWSKELNELMAAWAEAKKEMGVSVRKDGVGLHNNKYATLDASLEKAMPIFAKHGIGVIQMPTDNKLINLMTHKSGQWLAFEYPLNMKDRSHHAQGSALTYARRYCFQSLAGIAPGDDDDATAAMEESKTEPAQKPASTRGKSRGKKQHTGIAEILNVAEKVDMSKPDPPAADPPTEAPPPPEEPPVDPFADYEPTHQVKLYKRVIDSVKNEKDLENIKEQIKKQNFQGADREFLLQHFEMKENELSA